jgi:hypothetical protein
MFEKEFNKQNESLVWWYVTVIPTTPKVEAGGL